MGSQKILEFGYGCVFKREDIIKFIYEQVELLPEEERNKIGSARYLLGGEFNHTVERFVGHYTSNSIDGYDGTDDHKEVYIYLQLFAETSDDLYPEWYSVYKHEEFLNFDQNKMNDFVQDMKQKIGAEPIKTGWILRNGAV